MADILVVKEGGTAAGKEECSLYIQWVCSCTNSCYESTGGIQQMWPSRCWLTGSRANPSSPLH
ncbi:hypothetical protein GH733_008027 [Mirounga leonina]|nr:hypothetical protein GH733_008027 [Mirounga leonina]